MKKEEIQKDDQQTSKIVSTQELSNDDVAALYNILFSGMTISARIARNVVILQSWVARLVMERRIATTPKKK